MEREIGLNIQQSRYRRGLNQADLAEAMNLDRTVVSRIERGVRPVTASELVRIAQILDVQVTELLEPRAPHEREETPRLLLRGVGVGTDDEPQLAWFVATWSVLCAGRERGAAGLSERLRRLPTVQAGELAARRFRTTMRIDAQAPVRGLSAWAERAGVSVLLARLPVSSRISGCLATDDHQRSAALVNTNHPAVRQRFTLAHEIAHHLLDRGLHGYTCDAVEATRPGPRPAAELRADVFASALLLPERVVRQRAAARHLTLEDIREMSTEYGMSHAAVISRLRALRVLADVEARMLRRMGSGSTRTEGLPAFRGVTESAARILREQSSGLLDDCRVFPDEGAVP